MTTKAKIFIAILLILAAAAGIFWLFRLSKEIYFCQESENCKNGIFINHDPMIMPSAGQILKWKFGGKIPNPDWKIEDQDFKYSNLKLDALKDEELKITFIGHATFLLQYKDFNILTDPIWSQYASPLPIKSFKRYDIPAIPFEKLPTISHVVISHNHYDHMDIPTITALRDTFNPTFFVGLGNCHYLNNIKKMQIKCLEMDWWSSVSMGEIAITFTPAKHWSKRGIFDTNKTLWGGFVINFRNKQDNRVFFSGDTGYGRHFKEIKQKIGQINIGLLGIGAYKPDFLSHAHMNPDQAVMAHIDLECIKSIGMHFGTFKLSAENRWQPIEDLSSARTKHHISNESFVSPKRGESFNFKIK